MIAECIDCIDEAHVAPRAGPIVRWIDVGIVRRAGVGIGIGPSLFVADQRPIGRAVGADGLFPTCLPVDLVAAPEQQIYAGVARFLYIQTLPTGPIFVMSDRDEGLVTDQSVCAEPISVHA